MFTPPTSDPRRRARTITREIIAVGFLIITAMWVMAGASIMAAREAGWIAPVRRGEISRSPLPAG